MAISADNLTRITSRGWPAIESRPLGEWELRASGGFTGRANSVAVHGDPGVPFVEALTASREFYARRGLPPLAQVVVESAEHQAFLAAGWAPITGYCGAIVQVARLRERFEVDDSVRFDEHVSDAWLARYRRVGEDAAAARAVLAGPTTVAFLSIGESLDAIARVVVTGEWAGMACVEVAPDQRRRGLGRLIVEAGLDWARSRGADKAYLQTMADNEPALALYEPYGFRTHHEYVYLKPSP